MGEIIELNAGREYEEKIVKRDPVPGEETVRHDIGSETAFLSECYKEGMAPYFCPSCGQLMGGNYPMTVKWFECGVCGAHWECSNFKELFEKEYPEAGEVDEYE